MKPGERVRIIGEIAESLLTRPWATAQLVLDQFGYDTFEVGSYDLDEHTYFIDRVKDAPDDKLTQLHEYLFGDDAAPETHTGPWTGGHHLNVFLSHSFNHRHLVGKVKQLLALRGIDAFVAHDDIHPSQQWREVIKAALNTCHAFVAFLHEEFHDSQWCDQEVGWALGRGIPMLSVRPAGVERRDGFLEEHQDLLVQGAAISEWTIADQILEMVVRDPRTDTMGVRALAEALVNSGSYDSTRRFWMLLNAQSKIEPEQLRRVEYAVQTNRQVYEANAGQPPKPVPELVADLVARHEPQPPGDEPF